MITAFRRYLETWVVRGFFLIMVLAFVSWGVGDVIRLIGTSTWVAKVGGQTIEGTQLQEAYQRDMAQVTRNLPAGQEPTPDMRSGVGARGVAAADHPGGAEPGAAAAAHRHAGPGGAPDAFCACRRSAARTASSTARPSRRCCATTA